jgi:OmpA-OmpF porin, OOP family
MQLQEVTVTRKLLSILLLMLLAFATPSLAQEPDAEGCKDSPLITRMPGSTINSCDNKEFDQAKMPTGHSADGELVYKTLEGEYHHWTYNTREGVTVIQVFHNIETALKRAGLTIDYEESPGLITAHKGKAWYMLENHDAYYNQTVLIIAEMQQEVTADAASLASEIEKSGHVAVYGIHFDTGKAAILPDSKDTLQQIVQLLKDNGDLKLRIEGYTDNVGQAAANQALSEKRAQAVVAWLVAHDVASARLSGKGFGPANPVGDNTTEDGRAKNRRVELVKM